MTTFSSTPVVTTMQVIPVAGHDSMLMNLSGAHAPYFTRNIVIIKDNAGHTGVGEIPGGEKIRQTLEDAIPLVVRVEANDRSGLLRDITTILANEKVNVLGVASRSDTRQQLATIDMTIEIYNLQVLGRVLGKLNQVPDVIDARRLHGG